MTGWGQKGAWAHTAGHDINYLAMTGALHAMGAAGSPPAPPLNLVADFGGGSMFLVFGLLAAVIERGISGKGQVVDSAMVDGVPAMMGLIHGFLAQGAWSLERGGNWLDGSSHFYRCYECADGKFVAVGALEPQFYAELLSKLGLNASDLGDQFDRTCWARNSDTLAGVFRTRRRDAWAEIFAGTDACVAPVLDLVEARHHPVNTERDVFFEQDGVWQAQPAPRFGKSTPATPPPPDGPGAHGAEILSELGYSPDDLQALEKSGALT
jgi:alpha-methylacyl-CoA racemase